MDAERGRSRRSTRTRRCPVFATPWRSTTATRHATLDRFHARFVGAGDLAFDVGAHVGDHIGSFLRLGARVVAVEPQPACARVIRALYAGDDRVTLVEAACGAHPGTVRLHDVYCLG